MVGKGRRTKSWNVRLGLGGLQFCLLYKYFSMVRRENEHVRAAGIIVRAGLEQ